MASASPSAAPFSNEYYKRTVASEKTCVRRRCSFSLKLCLADTPADTYRICATKVSFDAISGSLTHGLETSLLVCSQALYAVLRRQTSLTSSTVARVVSSLSRLWFQDASQEANHNRQISLTEVGVSLSYFERSGLKGSNDHAFRSGFCSKLETPQPSSSSLHTPSQADVRIGIPYSSTALADSVSRQQIDSVTREWKDKQAKKNEDAEKSTREDSEKSEEKGSKKSPSVKAPTPSNNPGSGTASPRTASQLEKYALHKDIFRMRIEAWNRKRARSRAAQLPSIPRG